MKISFNHALPNWFCSKLSQAEQVNLISYPRFKVSGKTWLVAIKVTHRRRIVVRKKSPLQEQACFTEFGVSEQQTDDILLIDPDTHQNENLPDDMTYEVGDDEFHASNDDHCTDIDENWNDSKWCNICFKYCFKYINGFKTSCMCMLFDYNSYSLGFKDLIRV